VTQLSTSEVFDHIAMTRPTALVVELYDNAIDHLTNAVDAIEANDIERRCHQVNFATEAVAALHLGLDFDHGGDVTATLSAIYRFCLAEMIRINLRNDGKTARKIIDVLLPLREAWKQVDQQILSGVPENAIESAIVQHVESAQRQIEANAAA